MKLLTLARHAKSSWQDHKLSDHERGLNPRGLRDAPDMAQRFHSRGALPDRILCSSATRTCQTCDIFINQWALPASLVQTIDSLYLATTGTIQSLIEATSDDVEHLMLIAHNPGLEQLAQILHSQAPKRLPTCAMLQFELDQSNFKLDRPELVNLAWYDYPKNNN